MTIRRYEISRQLLNEALQYIPLGAQTFSKSHIQYPEGRAPLFLKRGEGGRVWDVDGNEYVDLVCGLLPVVLGYVDPDVNQAIQAQLHKGISFSLSTELEIELAKRLVELIPSAERVRFGKNGSDATAAAIRLARAYTKRERIAICGYHGWHDWYIGSTARHLGVPECVRDLTHRFVYNDLDSLEQLLQQYPNQFAAVIMEPMNAVPPKPGYLAAVKSITHQANALLIFDEIITGFRFHLGGAQSLFNVVPDLSTFGKSMGNGMPISAIVGREEIMQLMEKIFYSGTFGGETLSLAAAIAVIDKMKRESIIATLWQKGEVLANQVNQLIHEYELSSVISLSGMSPWKFINFSDQLPIDKSVIRTLFIGEMLANGVLIQGTHNICAAHNDADWQHVLLAYRSAFSVIRQAIDDPFFLSSNHIDVIKPIFSVR